MSRAILVVEDNRDLAENVRELFEDGGARVALAHHAREAERLMRERTFDLALFDVNLPGASGIELVPKLKEGSPHAEAVLVTGDATIGSAIEAVRHGVFAYVQKPFDPEDLLAVAERALAQVALRRERAELALELARSEALYRDVVDSVHSLLVGLDGDHRVHMWNERIAGATGIAASEAIGADACALLFDAEHRGTFEAALGEGPDGGDFLLPMRARGGQPKIVRWRIAPLRGGSDAQWLAVGEDVTERLALEARAADAEALAAMGRLTAGLAHEIRNPLNAAVLQLELMARAAGKLDDASVRTSLTERAAIVRSEIQRLSQLLDEFLGLARPRHFALARVDVAALLDELVAIHTPLATERGVTIDATVDGPLFVRGDAGKLKQALVNLIVNAIDALGGDESGRIALRARAADDGRVELCVEDDGRGLPAFADGDLFSAFVTTKEKGTGLGLAVVKQIVELHSGEITLLPRPGGGTVARLLLPSAERTSRFP